MVLHVKGYAAADESLEEGKKQQDAKQWNQANTKIPSL